jgi:hypothetical protein
MIDRKLSESAGVQRSGVGGSQDVAHEIPQVAAAAVGRVGLDGGHEVRKLWNRHQGSYRSQAGVLRDEGGCWWLETPPGAARPLAGTLRIAFDFGNWMLLRFEPEGVRQRWLAPSQADMPEAWPAFRRAVYSPRIAPAGLSAQAPADPPA